MGGSSFELGKSIRVVSDDYNNALLVYASPYEYSKIERILKKLDVVATQVLIEASIVEVQLTDGLEFGLEWTFQNGIGNNYQGAGALDLTGLAPVSPGFSYTVTSANDVRAVVNALAEESLVNVFPRRLCWFWTTTRRRFTWVTSNHPITPVSHGWREYNELH